MKRLIFVVFLVCLLLHTPVLADIDKFEGQDTANLSDIDGQNVPSTSAISYVFDETFVGYSTCVDGDFTESGGTGSIVSNACEYTSTGPTDSYVLVHVLSASQTEMDVEIEWKVDAGLFTNTAGQAEVLRMVDGTSTSLARVILWAPNPCTSPCLPGRLRVEGLADSGAAWQTPDLAAITVGADTYVKIRMYFRRGDIGSYGVIKVWIDDVLKIDNVTFDNDAQGDIDRVWVFIPGLSNTNGTNKVTLNYARGANEQLP